MSVLVFPEHRVRKSRIGGNVVALRSTPAGRIEIDAFRRKALPQATPASLVGRVVSTSREFVVVSFEGGVRITAMTPGGLSMTIERRPGGFGIMFDMVGLDDLNARDAEALLRDGVNGRLRLRCVLRGERTLAQHLERRSADGIWSPIAGVDRSGWMTWGTRTTYRFNPMRYASLEQLYST